MHTPFSTIKKQNIIVYGITTQYRAMSEQLNQIYEKMQMLTALNQRKNSEAVYSILHTFFYL